MPLEAEPVLTTTTDLSRRWHCCTRTVLRLCRFHALTEVRFRERGRVFFLRAEVVNLEKDLHIS